ncbi:low molecular weight phosphotyrosine protein phosphatase [Halomonas sp. NyZ770]|uniref:low molecular weight protein-tyrosine-phosphatase n=1 Tax=Halomonas sp. NyZ770 TaxID=2883106 RepID=UPI00054A9104|nr:low molecular weight protein-tyrosine-phosphatase [Halomonas sp. NyZ770]KHJ51760.1 phosphotyrosine protein phosphatase [Halomonas hydrothermalis]UDM08699.1 low molecular weight phosphotyrosine protein phosphatase [Halomonas sp. NyZ770]
MKRVLFVCLGNICRSPTAEGVFQQAVVRAGLDDRITIDSCGVGDWHVGKAPDPRSQAAARQRGIEIGHLRARQLKVSDFHEFDYVLGMDRENLAAMRALQPASSQAQVGLLLDYAGLPQSDVPDPYYGGDEGFEQVLDLIERASQGLLDELQRER